MAQHRRQLPDSTTQMSSQVVVLRAANPWDGTKFQDRHLAERLAGRGVSVLYVDPPMSHLTARRDPARAAVLAEPRLRELSPGLTRLTPVVLPCPRRTAMGRVTSCLLAKLVDQALRAGGVTADVVIDSDPLAPILGRLPARLQVYWAQDDFAGGAALLGQSAHRLQRGDAQLASRADVVIASSPVVNDRLREAGNSPQFIPFGCDSGLFASVDQAAPAQDVHLTGPVVGFVGHLAERIDLRLLEAIADRGRSLLLIGPVHPKFDIARIRPLLARPNVQWVGAKPFHALPSYLRHVDVGVVPYADTAFNRGSFPLKTLEYLAAGRAVVATALPSTQWLATDLIRLENEPAAFADAVDAALRQVRSADLVAARRNFAAQHDWECRTDQFVRVLGLKMRERAAEPG